MSVKFGGVDIVNAYLGTTEVRKIYFGEVEVWPRSGTVEGDFTGTGILSVPNNQVYRPALTLSGTGILSATMISALGQAANLVGTGSLSATTKPSYPLLVALPGNGSLTVVSAQIYSLLAAPSGSGTLSATAIGSSGVAVPLSGGGTLSGDIGQVFRSTLGASGTGTLSATAVGAQTGTAVLSGNGALSAALSQICSASANMTGGGSLSATVTPVMPTNAPLSGSGTLSATVSQRYTLGFFDDFSRPDSTTSPGPLWTNRYNTLGVTGNAAYATGSGDGSWGIATPNVVMVNDDMEASVIVKAPIGGNDYTLVGLGLNEAGQGVFYHCNGVGHYIYSQVTWYANWTMVAAVTSTAIATGDVMTIRRVGNVYTGLLNGVPMVGWPDDGNTIPRDAAHRLLEMGVYPGSRPVDSFAANSGEKTTGSGTLSATATKVPAPTITNVTTAPFYVGNTITVTGTGFVAPVSVTVGGVTASGVSVNSSTSLTCVIPSVGTGQQYVQVSTAAGVSNGLPINVVPKFSVDTVSPSTGAYNTAVTISGVGFTGTTSVTIGGVAALNRVVVNDTTITCNVPALSNGTYDVSVTSPSGSGTKTGAFIYSFTSFNETNTARTSQTVPAGCTGVWVTLVGGGGGGGGGAGLAAFGVGSGGGGGGGASRVQRVFVPVASLGATYSVGVGAGGAGGLTVRNASANTNGPAGTAGTASTFASGSVSLSAGGGGAGGGGVNGTATAGAAGVATASGVTATLNNGTAGGTSTASANTAAAVNNANGAAAGGSGGGGFNFSTSYQSGKGGDSSTAAGGAARTTAGAGNSGGGATAPNGGAGGSGSMNSAGTTAYGGGNGGSPGGGGGGATSCNALATNFFGGTGGAGYTLLEWV